MRPTRRITLRAIVGEQSCMRRNTTLISLGFLSSAANGSNEQTENQRNQNAPSGGQEEGINQARNRLSDIFDGPSIFWPLPRADRKPLIIEKQLKGLNVGDIDSASLEHREMADEDALRKAQPGAVRLLRSSTRDDLKA